MRYLILSLGLSLIFTTLLAQQHADFQFALVTDTHIGSQTAAEDLRRTVSDINTNDSLAFVIISGDITEFGSDAELLLARQILDSLNKPWYIIPGNHDTKWSESGGNSFRKIFGSETFAFVSGNFIFIGTNSGPNMRMGPGQIPRENIVWLDSVLNVSDDKSLPIIFVNHYPLDQGLNNWFEAVDRLKKRDIQLVLCGHGHSNRELNFEGIPGLMGRSNLRAKDPVGGYNVISVQGDTLLNAFVRRPMGQPAKPWVSIRMYNHHFADSNVAYPRPDFSMNTTYSLVKEVWRVQEKSDIGSGVALAGHLIISTTTDGNIKTYNRKTGRLCWEYSSGAKIYGTPAVTGDKAVVTATDGSVYALDLRDGKLLWIFDAAERIVASPVIKGEKVFIVGSGGKCYLLSLSDGSVIWSNGDINGFAETIPLIYKDMILFGTWGNRFYALNASTGVTRWEWNDGYSNRMLSPAACVAVATDNRIFIVAPDRKMTCLEASTGKLIWQSGLDGNNVRESMGVSSDSTLIYAKTMEGNIIGVPVFEQEGKITWKAETNIGYDIAPSVIREKNGVIFIASDKGVIYAIERESGKLLWSHRISSCLINQVLPVNSHTVICSSMDGVLTMLKF